MDKYQFCNVYIAEQIDPAITLINATTSSSLFKHLMVLSRILTTEEKLAMKLSILAFDIHLKDMFHHHNVVVKLDFLTATKGFK